MTNIFQNTNLATIDILIIAGYLAFCLVIGLLKYGKIRNIRDYTLGTRPFPTGVLIATTFATNVGANLIVGNVGKIHELGIVFIIPLFFIPICWFITANIFAPNLQNFQKLKFMFSSDIMDHWYGSTGRWVTNIASIILTMGVVASSTTAIGYLLHYFLNISEAAGIFIGISVVTLYSVFGGIVSVAFTDLFQFFIFFIALPLACSIGYDKIGGIENLMATLPKTHSTISQSNVLLFISLAFFALLPNTDISFIQRVLISKDKEQFKKVIVSVAILHIPILLVISSIGLISYQLNPNISSNTALYYFISNHLLIGMKGLMIAGLLAVIMSTLDSYLNTTSSLISNNICKKIWPSLTDKKELLLARLSCFFLAVASVVISLMQKGVIEKIWLVLNFWSPLVTFPLLAGLLGARVSHNYFKVLVGASLSATVITRLFTGVFDTRSLVVGVITSIIVLYVGNRKYKKEHPELIKPKNKKPLSLRFMQAAKANNFSINSIYVMSIIIGVNAISSVAFLNFNFYSALNSIFVIVAIASLMLVLNELWTYRTRKYIPKVWRLNVIFSITILPAYLLFASGFKLPWISYFMLSIILFFMLTNLIVGTGCTLLALAIGYAANRFITISVEQYLNTPMFTFSLCVLTLIAILVQLYQARHVDRAMLRAAQNQVDERTQELRLALNAREEFLNKVHHEINTPMTSIINIAGCMADFWPKLSDEERRKYAKTVSDSGNRLLKYTSHLIDMAKIRQDAYEIDIQTNIDLVKLAENAIRTIDSWIIEKNKNLTIKLEIKGNKKSILVDADETKIEQLFEILLSNAAKYSEQGEIILRITAIKSHVEIAVIDQGVGIAKDETMQIFTPFFEGSRTKSPAEGKGLGLSIAQKIVHLHYGCLKVRPNHPKGSIFYFDLPYKHIAEKSSSSSLQGTVLVIEDNKKMRDNFGKLITDLGYGVELAVSGQEALAYINDHHQDLDLVIINLDISKGISGITTLECLHKNLTYKTIPTIVYSQSKHDNENMKKAEELGTVAITDLTDNNLIKAIKHHMRQY